MPIILATQETGIRRVVVQSQPRQIVSETLSQIIHRKKRAGGVKTLSSSPTTTTKERKKRKKEKGRRRRRREGRKE
jgi:hypothetical protein